MGIRYAIQIALVLAFAAVATGQLPRFLNQVWKEQARFIEQSQTRHWGQALIP